MEQKEFYDSLVARNELVGSFLNKFAPLNEQQKNWAEAEQIKSVIFPKNLCKYLSLEESLVHSTLESFRLWFSRADKQNDPFESRPTIDESYLTECVNDLLMLNVRGMFRHAGKSVTPLKKWSLSKYRSTAIRHHFGDELGYMRWEREIKNNVLEKITRATSSTYITSLTEKSDCPLMWAHYAKNHSGICVEFCGEVIKGSKSYRNMWPVFYTPDRMVFDRCSYRQSWEGNSDFDYEPKSYNEIRVALTKGVEWVYEREWRYVLMKEILDKSVDAEKDEEIYKVPFQKIKNIYLGVNSNYSGETKEWLKGYAEKNNVSLFEMRMHPSKFELLPVPLF